MNNLMNRQWWAAAGTRCIKTGAQAALGTIGASAAVIGQVNWEVVAGAAALAAVVSLLTSLEGLPEVSTETTTALTPAAATTTSDETTSTSKVIGTVTVDVPVVATAEAATTAEADTTTAIDATTTDTETAAGTTETPAVATPSVPAATGTDGVTTDGKGV